MIDYYEQLTQEEKEEVTEVIQTLYRQTFLLERKFDKRAGRMQYTKEYRTCTKHLEFFKAYFEVAGIILRENVHMGVIYIQGEQLWGEKLPRLATIYLLVLKLIYDEQMQNAYVGIGVTITLQEQDGGMRVEQVTAGGPAEEAGMQVGDIITEVEGESTLTLGMAGTRAKVRGEEGTSVALTILRGGERLTLTVERRSIETAVATYEMLDDQIGYVKIANFDTRCFDEASAAIDALLDDGAQALIFDVRNNGGGYKDELVKILDRLLPEGILFQSEDYSGTKQTDRSDTACIELPMAVLVNQDSYSAAEFFAAALQEYGWATVVGTKTCGKGNFQTAFTLSDGSMLNLSIGKYFTPNGRSLTDIGVTPDEPVELSDEDAAKLLYGQLAHTDDAQLQAAIRAIRQKIS